MPDKSKTNFQRDDLIHLFQLAERQHSTATIFFHSAIAGRFHQKLTDWICADIIFRKGPLTAGQLAEQVGLSTGAVTGLIDRLEKANVVHRRPDPQDRRRVIVESQPNYEEMLALFFESVVVKFSEVLANYNDQELALIIDYTKRSAIMMEQEAIKLRTEAPSLDS